MNVEYYLPEPAWETIKSYLIVKFNKEIGRYELLKEKIV